MPTMKRLRLIMVLCPFLIWVPDVIGQLHPFDVADQFFSKKLVENSIRADFHFEDPIRYGNIWIFECSNPAGFVLVRESDSCRVVGYSIGNRFTRDNKIPDPAVPLIESLSSCPEKDLNAGKLKTTYDPIGPMIRTTWSQEGYFNYYCPKDPNGPDSHVYVGCAAVAMGQIVRYYGKFNNFQLTAESQDNTYGLLTANVGNYNWSRMENRPITIDTEVSRLLFGLGVLTQMDFGPTASGTSNYNVYNSFKKLKYFDAIRMIRTSTTNDVWIKIFYQNITEYQPIYVSGSGHSFVCDGIDSDGMFHYNLGWYGYADGFYPLNTLLTITVSEAIFNLKPYSNNLPPANLTLDTLSGQKLLKWHKHRLATMDPVLYRVYLNDTTYYETRDSVFNTTYFPAGNHELMVSAVYTMGESSWVGPIQLRIEGNFVDIPDLTLKRAIRDELTRENVTLIDDSPTLNQLLKLQKLEITEPVTSLSGLEYCGNLQILTITPDETVSLDLGPLSRLKRLKWLDLKNINSNTISLLTHNDRLIHLDLTNCPVNNFDFLNGLTGLLSLSLHDLPILDTQVFGKLLSLKQLSLIGCNLTTMSSIQNLNNLEYLDLSRNQIQRFRLTDKLPELHDLNLSRNILNELYFLEYIPNIEWLNLGFNQLTRFITGVNFKNIKELNLENNSIDSLWFGIQAPTLNRLSVNGNKIRTIGLLKEYAPSLTRLDASGNLLQDFWQGNLQALEYLNLSNNHVNLLNDLLYNPLLKHIDLSNNHIADLYPVFDHSYNNAIQYLDLTGNPLSGESIEEFAPSVHSEIDTLLLPDLPQMFSPGNPFPLRNHSLSSQAAELSWLTGTLPSDGSYEVYVGLKPDDLKLSGVVETPRFQMDITAGQHYFWRVRTVLPDTSFVSGLFKFITYQPFILPFKENFEGYPPYSYFSQLSDYWIKESATASASTDGRIDPSRRSEGKQSLKLYNASDLKLPMSHLYQSALYMSMQLLIDDDCLASVRLNNIYGTDLRLYFKSNERCDILVNNQLISEVPFQSGIWFPVQVNLYGDRDDVWIKIGDSNIPIPWIFTHQTVHLDEIEFASAPSPNWPNSGQQLFHLDNLEIKASGSLSTQTIPFDQEILVYPNPADDKIFIDLPGPLNFSDIRLSDYTGKMISPDLAQAGQDVWTLNTRNLSPGIYLLRVNSAGVSRVAKIFISR